MILFTMKQPVPIIVRWARHSDVPGEGILYDGSVRGGGRAGWVGWVGWVSVLNADGVRPGTRRAKSPSSEPSSAPRLGSVGERKEGIESCLT